MRAGRAVNRRASPKAAEAPPVVEAIGRTPVRSGDGAFRVDATEQIVGLSVLLADDVVTIGPTLVACSAAKGNGKS